ncbi:molybdopterin-dependent oxidoreductase [Thioclava sp. GXIMD2076]|uniref:molybdopterin-dependent oxidoreductase n=1 Tax=Thioclava sp. GXIMD2076 TaxID=3131931 RepID=UPI0030D0417D
MTSRQTLSHWGTYDIVEGPKGVRLKSNALDPDPNPIGLHQLSPEVARTRVLRPAIRKSWLEQGPGARPDLRGREAFVEVSWDKAAELAGAELDRIRQTYGNKAIFGGSYGWASAGRFHHAQSQVHRFLNTIGGYVAHRDSYSLAAARVVLPHVVAPMAWLMNNHNTWDDLAAHCDLFLTLGGVPLKNAQISQAGVARHRVREGLRQMAGAGVECINVSPLRDNMETGAPVEWLPIRPGSDTAFLLALAHEIRAMGAHDRAFLDRYCTGWEKFEPYLTGARDGQPKDADWAAPLCGIEAPTTRALARKMAGKRVMINIAWALQRAEHGEQPFWMVVTLAAMLGQIGLPGGGFGVGYGAENLMGSPHAELRGASLPQGINPVKEFIPVARIADMLLTPGAPFTYDGETYSYPDIRLVYWAGGNPYHHHQDLNRLERAWQKPDTIIVHEQAWTATARRADIVLPVSMAHEREDLGYATMEGVVMHTHKAAEPPGLAESDYAIFTRIARVMGVEEKFTENRSEAEWIESLYGRMRKMWAREGVDLPDYAAFSEAGVIDLQPHDPPEQRVMLSAFRADPEGAPLETPSGRIEIFSEAIHAMGLPDCFGHPTWLPPGEWAGEAAPDQFHLISDQPARKLHSQLDASPHSLAGKIHGREPAHLNDRDAARLGLAYGDLVEIHNARGRCLASAVPDAGVAPNVLRLSTGAWFDPCPETGLERHGNPNVLTQDRPASQLSQGCAAHSCLVRIVKATQASAPAPFTPPELA